MRFYCFRSDEQTSEVLKIDLKDVGIGYRTYYDNLGVLTTYVGLEIWWPNTKFEDIDLKKLVESTFLSVLGQNVEKIYPGWLDKIVYDRYISLKGISDWHDNQIEYIRLYKEIESKNYEKEIVRLAESQKVAFQDLNINARLLDAIHEVYPEKDKPWGIYLNYWEDPSTMLIYEDLNFKE